MKLQTLFGVVALALTAQASSNSTNIPATLQDRRGLAFTHHPRSWLNGTSRDIPSLNKRNGTVTRSVNNGTLHN
ncbi:uncharacterized protein KD926_006104 [Aspergillus affinis]|uniref:uncharacterized protein n=1 Tax=Aspergillus affinis TaxID=1070780 RepID=UPI0022FF2162|nr:uncharacterized protein KD926_006104 [Aspergillus affinis]KAI9042185.1 hypothetical protein KD926_006104 [Aspergillus affinis]